MDFIDRIELPDGQSGTFRRRIGYGESMLINHAIAAEKVALGQVAIDNPVYVDAVMRAFLIRADILDYETSEMLRDVDPSRIVRARPDVAEQLIIHAYSLYVGWLSESAPKAPAATDDENVELETSRSSPPRANSKRKTKT
jgi:hypothetical protein